MIVIGLTGSIATGKSTVSRMLTESPHKLPIIDADVIAREVVEPGTPGYTAIVKHFAPTTPDLLQAPSACMPENGTSGKGRPLNRAALGSRVFGDSEERKRDRAVLNRIVHPAVRFLMFRSIVLNYLRGHWAVVLDVPLLFESNLDPFCGIVMVVAVHEPALQMKRLLERNNHLSGSDAERRVRSQSDIRDKVQRCAARGSRKSVLLWNDGSLADLKSDLESSILQVKHINPLWWSWLLLMCPPIALISAIWTVSINLLDRRQLMARRGMSPRSLATASQRQ